MEDRVYFDVFYGDKDEAKELGAKWDNDAKAWYAVKGSSECEKLEMVFEIKEIDSIRKK